MADRNYIQASPILASYPEYKNTYIYLTFRVKNKYDWNGTGNVYLKYIGRKAGNVPIENNFVWDSSRKWCFHDNTKITPMSNGTIDGQLFGNSNGITLTERLWDSTISDKYFSSDPNSPLYNRYYIFTPPTQGTSVQDEETYIIMRYETDNDGNVITLDTNGTATEMIRLSFEIPTGCDLQTVMLYDVRIHAKSKNASCSSVIYEDVLIDGNNNIKYVDNEVFTITTNVANGNGSITPYEGTKTYVKGSTASYTFVPESGYEVQYAIVDGVIRQGATSQGFINIHENHSIIVYFIKQQQVTYECTANYVAYPSSDIIQPGIDPCPGLPYTKSDVIPNSNFEVVPQIINQYGFDKIIRKDNNGEQEVSVSPVNGKYTFDNIISNTDITFRLVKIGPFELSYDTDNNGTLDGKISDTIRGILAGTSKTLYYSTSNNKVLGSTVVDEPLNKYTPTISKQNKSITINNIVDDIHLYVSFDDAPDPKAREDWQLQLLLNVPSAGYVFKFTLLDHSYTSNNPIETKNDLIDCNWGGTSKVVMVNGVPRARAFVDDYKDSQDSNLFNLQFISAGTYVISFTFMPNLFTVDEIYANIIEKIRFNANNVTTHKKPILTFNDSSNLKNIDYLNVKYTQEEFDENLKILGSGHYSGVTFNSGNASNYIKQIGLDSTTYGDNKKIETFSDKIIHNWNRENSTESISSTVELLRGRVFENSTLPIRNLRLTNNNVIQNCLFMEKANQMMGPVFKNTTGYNIDTHMNANIETFISSRSSLGTSWRNASPKLKGITSSSASTMTPEGPWTDIVGLKKIAVNHSKYENYCFHGIILPTQSQIDADPIPSETQKQFLDSTTPYFKLLIKNYASTIEFDNTIFEAVPGYSKNFDTTKVILYLMRSVINSEVQGVMWRGQLWAEILPIEDYSSGLYNNLPGF